MEDFLIGTLLGIIFGIILGWWLFKDTTSI